MCGRINVSSHPLATLFMELAGEPFPGPDRYNVAPTLDVPVIRASRSGDRVVSQLRWWLIPYWLPEPATRYSMFNAKSETLETSRAFREPFARRRCLVPVSGFYEWRKEDGRRLPYYIRPESDEGLVLAGIWDRWRDASRTVESFAIITVPVHEKLAFLHDRQPAMLNRDACATWLDRSADLADVKRLLSPAVPEPLALVPVSTYVSNSRNEGPRCIEPIGKPTIATPFDEDAGRAAARPAD